MRIFPNLFPIRQVLVDLYPPEWRERYGDEFAALLDVTPLSPRNLVDVLMGALDARRLAHDWRAAAMINNRLRRAEITVFCAYIAFVVAGLGFAKIVEYDDFHDVARAHPLIGLAFTTLVVGAYIALAAVVIGGLPLALAVASRALAARRWGTLALLGVPLLAFAVLAGYTLVLGQVIAPALHAGSGPTPGNVTMGISLAIVFVFCAVVSTAAVTRAIARSDIPQRLYRFAWIPAVLATLAMLVVTTSLLVWGLSLRVDAPSLFNGDDGLMASNTAANWLVLILLMGAATVVAVAATIRGWSARAEAPMLNTAE
jgi:hypothetical protein